jgi:hypothetical protein
MTQLAMGSERGGAAGGLVPQAGRTRSSPSGAVRQAARGVSRWFAGLPRLTLETYRKGLALPVAAPLVAGVVVVPQFAQHVVEIDLGMFVSKAGFAAHALDPLRLGFGAAKVAGLVICALAAARYWSSGGSVRRTLLVPPRDLGRALFAAAVNYGVTLPAEWATASGAARHVTTPLLATAWILSFLTLPYVVGAVLGDREMTLRRSLARAVPMLPTMAVLVVAATYPASQLHMLAHKLAIGAPEAAVWALMAADALLVGFLATLAGTALALAYRGPAGRPEGND